MIHVGFTGTRYGMTLEQHRAVVSLVCNLALRDQLTAHHGDCIGADAQFHGIAREAGARMIVHPPLDGSHRAWVKTADEWRQECTHLARNRCIVVESTVMIATPFQAEHQPRGGTWYTVDYAQKMGKPLALVLPSGDVVRNGSWPG